MRRPARPRCPTPARRPPPRSSRPRRPLRPRPGHRSWPIRRIRCSTRTRPTRTTSRPTSLSTSRRCGRRSPRRGSSSRVRAVSATSCTAPSATTFDLDQCNLQAIDATDGSIAWEDRIDGSCLLDEASMVTNPLVDGDGNVYTGDSRMLVSFTAEGELRWTNDVIAGLPSEKGLINPPFGINRLPTGELVTVTLGDGWVLVFDPDTGELLHEPFDLPSAKSPPASGGPLAEQPDGFMLGLLGPRGADLIYDYSFGASEFEVDNNVSVVPGDSGMFVIAGGAMAPNEDNKAGLWVLELTDAGPEVVLRVEIDAGDGGVGTTPVVSADGEFVLMGDNGTGIVAVDLASCLAETERGGVCVDYTTAELGRQLGISPGLYPDGGGDRDGRGQGRPRVQLGRDDDGNVELAPLWQAFDQGGTIAGSVSTLYDNAVATMAFNASELTAELVLLDPHTGEVLSRMPSGDFANVSLAADGETFIVNHLNAVTEILGGEAPAGVEGWRAVPTN
ncbi:MAG: PQQ-binding-like beta-propeller repeat protein [Acidimicrobiales bacterium]